MQLNCLLAPFKVILIQFIISLISFVLTRFTCMRKQFRFDVVFVLSYNADYWKHDKECVNITEFCDVVVLMYNKSKALAA